MVPTATLDGRLNCRGYKKLPIEVSLVRGFSRPQELKRPENTLIIP